MLVNVFIYFFAVFVLLSTQQYYLYTILAVVASTIDFVILFINLNVIIIVNDCLYLLFIY